MPSPTPAQNGSLCLHQAELQCSWRENISLTKPDLLLAMVGMLLQWNYR